MSWGVFMKQCLCTGASCSVVCMFQQCKTTPFFHAQLLEQRALVNDSSLREWSVMQQMACWFVVL